MGWLDGMDWKHDGDGWSASACGACPVQAEGHVDGLPFYFRARHDGWSFSVSEKPDGDPVGVKWGDTRGWCAFGDYDGSGWMQAAHSRAIVEACIRRWREVRGEPFGDEVAAVFSVEGVPTEAEPLPAPATPAPAEGE